MVCGKPRLVQPVKEALLRQRVNLYLGPDRLLPLDKVKNLGVYFDEALTGIHQISHILQQVYGRLRQLYHFNNILSVETKKKLILSLVFPYFDYGDLIFFHLKGGLEAKLEVAQNNCIRFIYNLRRYETISGYRTQLGFLKPQLRRKFRMSVFIYKVLGSATPGYLRNLLVLLDSGHDTRNRLCSLRVPICHSSYFKASFQLSASKVWNGLDPPLRRAETLFGFKRGMMDFILQRVG
jgi:hypothetical protein